MSVQRYINSSFWSDDWVDSLSIQEKLIYMYLLTNENTNIAGVYKITIKRIKDDTGISREEIVSALQKFSTAKKAFYRCEYIIIPKWPKHQKLGERGKLKLAVNAILRSLSPELKDFIMQPGNYDYDTSFLFPADSSQIPYPENSKKDDSISIPYPENDEDGDTILKKTDMVCQKDDTLSSDSDSDFDFDLDSDFDVKNTHIELPEKENDLFDPQKLFILIWQNTPDVFNTFAHIDSVEEWKHFWDTKPFTCEQVKTALNNFIADVRKGIIEQKYIPSTPDRFALRGWINKCQKRYTKEKSGPPEKPVSKKSLGGLVV